MEPTMEPKMEPIAIVGMACRFPGAPSLSAFWDMLAEGRHGISEVPAERWDVDALYDADAKAPGKVNTRFGGFLENVDQFDAAFFAVSPREAVQMDPQQRILAELSYEALEDAGLAPATLAGSDTAVYVGLMSNDYQNHQGGDDWRKIDVHTGSGAGYSMTANRLSYLFDFRGPSVAVDSACSSSLVAVFQGCQAIWTGQANLALAAGTNLMLSPAFSIFYTKGGLSAADGKCKTFSAAADGIGRGDGAGVVILKRLADAQADGDRVYAVIRGGAVNHDGRSNGLTAPNRWAQEKLLRTAFRQAGVKGSDLQYVELHGTGTLIGDPIEANALGAVLLEDPTPRARPCLVGSVKTNVGHLEGAAGIVGLIKLALSMSKRRLPASLWYDAGNPHINLDKLPLQVNTELASWPNESGPCLAGVSSFGLGGTNAHLVLESAPDAVTTPTSTAGSHCLLLSAKTEAGLQQLATQYIGFLEQAPETALASICHSAVTRKGVHELRLSMVASDKAGMLKALHAYQAKEPSNNYWNGRYRQVPRKRVVVVAPQQPVIDCVALADWLSQAPAGQQAWRDCRQAAREHATLPDLAALAMLAPLHIGDAGYAQIHFAGQYAQLQQLRSVLAQIDTLVADGLGQLASYSCAGALTLEQAFAIIGDVAAAATMSTGNFRFPCITPRGSNLPLAALDWQADAAAVCALGERLRKEADAQGLWLSSGSHGAWTAVEAGEWLETVDGGKEQYWRTMARLATRHQLVWRELFSTPLPFYALPAYPWQRQSYWMEKSVVAPAAAPQVVTQASVVVASSSADSLTRRQLYALTAGERRPTLLTYLTARIAAALHMPAANLDPLRPLNSIGIDSLTAVEVKNRIERDFKVTVPIVKFLDGFAVADFADFMLAELGKAADAQDDEVVMPVGLFADDIDPVVRRQVEAMSLDQVDDMLRQLLPQG